MRIKSSLRKLIYKLRISFKNKKIRKKLKVLVAFLINKKIGGQQGFLPHSFFLEIIRSKLWESHLAKKKKKKCKFRFNYSFAESQNQNMHWFKNRVKVNSTGSWRIKTLKNILYNLIGIVKLSVTFQDQNTLDDTLLIITKLPRCLTLSFVPVA